MSVFTCPYCYREHDIKDCKMKCSLTQGGDNTICPEGVPKPDGWIVPKFYKKCMKCTMAVKDVYCPIPEKPGAVLDKIIPQRCILAKSLPIALIGAKATGKSNYICVLVNEIRKKMSLGFDTSINMSCDMATRTNYEEFYYRPLYREKMQISATDKGKIPPMIFPIDFPKGKQVTLTFYDTAGENLDDLETIKQDNGYLPNSKGIILLLDPLQLPQLRTRLSEKLNLPEQNTAVDMVLDAVTYNLEGYGRKNTKDIPLAVVFTKLDALDEFEDILPAYSPLRNESTHVDSCAFRLDEFENTQHEMRNLLAHIMGDSEFRSLENKIKKTFTNYAFFGASALGCSPDLDGRLPGTGVKPRRVLDPLLWLLKENKFIKVVKK